MEAFLRALCAAIEDGMSVRLVEGFEETGIGQTCGDVSACFGRGSPSQGAVEDTTAGAPGRDGVSSTGVVFSLKIA